MAFRDDMAMRIPRYKILHLKGDQCGRVKELHDEGKIEVGCSKESCQDDQNPENSENNTFSSGCLQRQNPTCVSMKVHP